MKARFPALLACGVLLSFRAYACSCIAASSACGAMKPRGTMFLGEVIGHRSVQIADYPGRSDMVRTENVFRIRVVEPFSGGPKAGDNMEVRTGGGGGDCGYGFETGRRYLVDAYDLKPEGDIAALRDVHLGTGICSHTQDEASAGVALQELRTELTQGRQPDLHGTVRASAGRYAQPGRPLPGVVVSLKADRDGAVYVAKTEAGGIYTFPVLPPGEYRPEFALPPQQKLITYSGSKPLRVVIPANSGSGLACHLDALAGPTGGVRGRVVDGSGRPLEGTVAAHRLGGPAQESSFNGRESKGGNFELEYLANGEYRLEFRDYQTNQRGSTPVTVRNGVVTTGAVIVAAHSIPDR